MGDSRPMFLGFRPSSGYDTSNFLVGAASNKKDSSGQASNVPAQDDIKFDGLANDVRAVEQQYYQAKSEFSNYVREMGGNTEFALNSERGREILGRMQGDRPSDMLARKEAQKQVEEFNTTIKQNEGLAYLNNGKWQDAEINPATGNALTNQDAYDYRTGTGSQAGNNMFSIQNNGNQFSMNTDVSTIDETRKEVMDRIGTGRLAKNTFVEYNKEKGLYEKITNNPGQMASGATSIFNTLSQSAQNGLFQSFITSPENVIEEYRKDDGSIDMQAAKVGFMQKYMPQELERMVMQQLGESRVPTDAPEGAGGGVDSDFKSTYDGTRNAGDFDGAYEIKQSVFDTTLKNPDGTTGSGLQVELNTTVNGHHPDYVQDYNNMIRTNRGSRGEDEEMSGVRLSSRMQDYAIAPGGMVFNLSDIDPVVGDDMRIEGMDSKWVRHSRPKLGSDGKYKNEWYTGSDKKVPMDAYDIIEISVDADHADKLGWEFLNEELERDELFGTAWYTAGIYDKVNSDFAGKGKEIWEEDGRWHMHIQVPVSRGGQMTVNPTGSETNTDIYAQTQAKSSRSASTTMVADNVTNPENLKFNSPLTNIY